MRLDAWRDFPTTSGDDVADDVNEGTVTDGYNLGWMGLINLGLLLK